MDFRNLCQKLDIDAIRAKLPSFPALPALPQIKLPKLKPRKIFRSSRENVNRNSPQNKPNQHETLPIGLQLQTLPPIPPAGFIKHTPTRISTISSLMNQDSGGEESTYRSANSIDEDYAFSCSSATIRATSSMAVDRINQESTSKALNTQPRLTFTERLHQSYKDLSEFRLKHIFSKKTVVRRDSIQVQHYVTRYEEDLIREVYEQERRDSMIAENYTLRFKVSQHNPGHSNSVTPDDSPRSEPIFSRKTGRSVGALSGDESGMEATPPPRNPGIAASRFAKVRNPPLKLSSSEQEDEMEGEVEVYPKRNESSVYAIRRKQQEIKQSEEVQQEEQQQQQATARSKFSYKEGMRRFKSYMSTHEDSDAPEATQGSSKMFSRITTFKKRAGAETKQKTQASPNSSDEEEPTSATVPSNDSPTGGRAINAFKTNFKRLQQSIKIRSHQTPQTDESGDEQKSSGIASKAEKLKTRLRKFRSRDISVDDLDADNANAMNEEATTAGTQSPIRQAMENLKKSFKKRPSNKADESQHQSDGETSPEREKQQINQKRSDTLIKKLRHIRTRKNTESKDEPDQATNTDGEAVADGEASKSKSRAKKFSEARQRTFKKVNEKMQNMKFFHKSQEQHEQPARAAKNKEKKYHSEEEDWDESESPESEHNNQYDHQQQRQRNHEQIVNLQPPITRRDFPPPPPPPHGRSSAGHERLERMAISGHTIDIPSARAAWTTKPILSQSTESDIDPSELPRVLIHQDNSDSYESTLIIAVTRPVACSSPIITEIKTEEEEEEKEKVQSIAPERQLQKDWVPNRKIIEGFMQKNPPTVAAGHKRRQSVDSSSNSDSDTWLPESKAAKNSSRRASQAGLVSIDEKSEAWKVKPTATNESQSTKLYKTKSIDIFEKNVLKGGALTAFEDFDDELRDEPVLKIVAKDERDVEMRESSEDTADDDSSSRVTKISGNRSSEVRESSVDSTKAPTLATSKDKQEEPEKKLFQYGNSRESLIANFDENDENDAEDDENDDEEDDEHEDDDDRPPSETPSPPPKMSPPPPPITQRQPSVRIAKKAMDMPLLPPPPLPKSKPPPLPQTKVPTRARPPRIPERTASMAPRAPKPLVKTSSLRLVYSEQVKPADVGKVNKLISQFEPVDGNMPQRPRIIPRRAHSQDDSEDFSDDEEDYAAMVDKLKERYANIKIERDMTPTPTNTPKRGTPQIEEPKKGAEEFDSQIRIKREFIVPMVVTTTDEDNNVKILSQPFQVKPLSPSDLPLDHNANNSRANSEYGSPLEYPSSLRGSFEVIPIFERRDGSAVQQSMTRVDRNSVRSRRSMAQDDENFYSFDSDEENSYYSITSTNSNRYIVEL